MHGDLMVKGVANSTKKVINRHTAKVGRGGWRWVEVGGVKKSSTNAVVSCNWVAV